MKWRKEVQTTQRSFTVRNRENEAKLGQENRIKRDFYLLNDRSGANGSMLMVGHTRAIHVNMKVIINFNCRRAD